MNLFKTDPLEEIRLGQFLHSTMWNWVALIIVFFFFPAGLVLSKLYEGCFFYALLSVELLLLLGSILWLKLISRRAIFVTIFLVLLSASMIHGFAVVYALLGICSSGCSSSTPEFLNDLYSAVYFSIVTWTTLGYGDFQPLGWVRLIASMEALIGYVFMGIVVGFSAQITYELFKQSHTTKTLKNDLENEVGYEGTPED